MTPTGFFTLTNIFIDCSTRLEMHADQISSMSQRHMYHSYYRNISPITNPFCIINTCN